MTIGRTTYRGRKYRWRKSPDGTYAYVERISPLSCEELLARFERAEKTERDRIKYQAEESHAVMDSAGPPSAAIRSEVPPR
jgi:hypothetical protein